MSKSARRRQAGYTLVELLVATAIGAIVIGAMTSIVLTTSLSTNIATSHIDASAEIRNFQLAAYDDVALSALPAPSGCGSESSPCTVQPMVLSGQRIPNQVGGAPASYTVTYTWDQSEHEVNRQAGAGSRTVARDVTGYSWYVDSNGAHPELVVTVTVTVQTYNASSSQTQTFRFLPRLNG